MLSPLRGWDALRYAPAAPNKGVKATSASFLFFGVQQVEIVQIISFGCAI